jgi:phage terminase large subunit
MAEDQKFNFQDTEATRKIFALDKRIRAVCGGTSASKTISILVWLIDYAQSRKNKKIDVMSESYPHLKDGAIRDFKLIMIDRGYWRDSSWNETDHVYKFETASIIKFISIDKLGKAHGPRRDVLFLNEANNIPWPIYEQMEVRTKEVIWLDWNPSEEFWYYDKIKGQVEHDFLTLTYLDCLDVLDPRIVASIESKKNNKNWWLVYGLGQLGEVEGRIFTGWQIIDSIPFEARLERYGLDFGYSNDPTAIVAIYKYNGSFIVDEVTYQKGLSNKQIADILSIQPKALVIADSAEPKSIDEIASYGILIQPSQKGQGSVLQGIQYVQDQKISITARSTHGLKEYRNYMWQTNKDGKIINEPEPGWDHFNDALRYALESLKPQDDSSYDSINYGLKSKWRL